MRSSISKIHGAWNSGFGGWPLCCHAGEFRKETKAVCYAVSRLMLSAARKTAFAGNCKASEKIPNKGKETLRSTGINTLAGAFPVRIKTDLRGKADEIVLWLRKLTPIQPDQCRTSHQYRETTMHRLCCSRTFTVCSLFLRTSSLPFGFG